MISSPPHAIKAAVVIAYAKRYSIHTFVETGTFQGDMILAVRQHFKKIYSIELDDSLYSQARQRFATDVQIEILHGDSHFWLRRLRSKGLLTEPTLFWLDAHYSGEGTARGIHDTPIMGELSAVLDGSNDVILIDDAHLFGSVHWPTLDDVKRIVSFDTTKNMIIEDDIIRIWSGALADWDS